MRGCRVAWLVRCYPQAWRERYGDEFAAVLDAQPGSLIVVADALAGALDAHLHAAWFAGRMSMERRLRLYEVAFFCAFMLFVVGFLPFGRVADPTATFEAATRAHPTIAAVYHGVVIAAEVATLVVALGGVPVLLASALGAWRAREMRVLRPFLGAVALVVLYGAYTLGMAAFEANTRPGYNTPGGGTIRPIDVAVLSIFLLFTLVGAALGPVLLGLVVTRARPPLRLLRFALWCASVALALMTVVLAGTITIMVLIQTEAPSLNTTQDTEDRLLLVMIVCMAAGVVAGGVALWRALRLRPEPEVAQARAA